MNSKRINLRANSFLDDVALFLPGGAPAVVRTVLSVGVFFLMAKMGGAERVRKPKVANAIPAAVPAPASSVDRVSVHQAVQERVASELCVTGSCEWETLSDGVRLSFSAAELFQSGSADLTPAAMLQLPAVAKWLVSPAGARAARVEIESHTDDLPVVKNRKLYPTNWELSGARSFAVVRLLEQAGVAPGRMSGAGYGSSRPKASNGSEQGRRVNRRLIIQIHVT
jgi:flagellar motor protein MotB